jgi:hypothetical protein
MLAATGKAGSLEGGVVDGAAAASLPLSSAFWIAPRFTSA